MRSGSGCRRGSPHYARNGSAREWSTDESGQWRTDSLRSGPASMEVLKQGFGPSPAIQLLREHGIDGQTCAANGGPENTLSSATAGPRNRRNTLTKGTRRASPCGPALSERRCHHGASVSAGYESAARRASAWEEAAYRPGILDRCGNGQSMRLGSGHNEFDPAVEELSGLRWCRTDMPPSTEAQPAVCSRQRSNPAQTATQVAVRVPAKRSPGCTGLLRAV